MDIHGTYKYLGIYTGVGRNSASHVTKKLEKHLSQLSKAPLKPQQRLFFLRVHVLPGLYHDLVLDKQSRALLVAIDRMSRKAVRRWLHLPQDVPRALIHAQNVEGRLGLPELTAQIPLMRSARVEKLFARAERGNDPVLAAIVQFSKELREQRRHSADGVKCYTTTVTNRSGREQATASALHISCDGAGLTDCRQVLAVSRWVSSGNLLMSRKSYTDALYVRAGCDRGAE